MKKKIKRINTYYVKRSKGLLVMIKKKSKGSPAMT